MHNAPVFRPVLQLTKTQFLKELGDAFDEAAQHGLAEFGPYMITQARGLVVGHIERLRREAEQPVEPPPHEILGLEPDATSRQIEDAWKLYARKHDPHKGGRYEAFYRGARAYNTLIKEKLRQAR
jgi:hypothetical protein